MNKLKIVIVSIVLVAAATIAIALDMKSFASETEMTQEYTEEDLYVLSHLIMGEGEGASEKFKQYVGSVVLNRVTDDRFPDSIKKVVFQSGQYSCTWDGRYDLEPTEECIEVAEYLLENGSVIDEGVVWQAEFKQGTYVYDYFENNYFCG